MLADDNPDFFSWLLRGVAPGEGGVTIIPHHADLNLTLRELAGSLRHYRMEQT
jgi:hypothetical protein